MDKGRPARRTRGQPVNVAQLPWRRITNRYPPVEVLSADELEHIHSTALEILECDGVEFLLDEALDILQMAGAEVDRESKRVRFERGLILESLAKAPREFVIRARNPEHDIVLGARNINFATVASAPNSSDRERGRRPGVFADFEDFLRLAQIINVVHTIGGYPVEPADLPAGTRHLDCVRSMILLSDKTFRLYALGRVRISDGLEMARISRGLSRDELVREPCVYTNVNVNSPLRIDGPMLAGLIEMATHNQAIIITPFTLCGAMAPVTLAGALAQQNAEALAAIAFAQMVRPGTPVVYGGFTSNVDMKSGAPAFGTPENVKATLASGQLARRYGLPFRASNTNASNSVDAQATYESLFSLWAAVMGGSTFVQHGAGWLEGGLVASFEKMILDAELLQNIAEMLEPIRVDAETLALDAIREVGPGGHFFGASHTLARYRDAFYAPLLSDWHNYETWREKGAQTTDERATSVFKKLLAEYEPPPIDPAIVEALDDFVARRKDAGGVES
ncbi:MAG: trimethylamine---corrinoid protein Co-methyltransferase [Rhodospirillaceae bacterium]|nr:trimethylamine---corrinoid protein Co-methyltransferase [Rhodospirillaceae bacterium]